MYVSFKNCNFPGDCYFNEKMTQYESIPLINNIGIWYIEKTINPSELELIYIYCELECVYDIIM